MSRCFPYPPPGYTREGIAGLALVETLKLRREAENAKIERKREKKKAKKEREGEHEHKIRHSKKRSREKETHSTDVVAKKAKHKPEPIDKSTVTEEFTNPSNSQNSIGNEFAINNAPPGGKVHDAPPGGKVHDAPPGGKVHVLECKDQKLGTEAAHVLRFRFPVPKQIDADPTCSTSVAVPETLNVHAQVELNQKYLDLVANWVPQEVALELSESDDSWLLDKNPRGKLRKGDSVECGGVDACHSATPRAQYCPDAGVYIMPYTMPF